MPTLLKFLIMTRLFQFFAAIIVVIAFSGCEVSPFDGFSPNPPSPGGGNSSSVFAYTPCLEDEDVEESNLPASVLAYLDTNYPNAAIEDADRYTDAAGNIAFGIELTNDVELLIQADGTLVSSGTDTEEVNLSLANLPDSIAQYLSANYPQLSMLRAELETEYGFSYIEVYFANSSIELYFTNGGTFVCQDDDDDDDDDDNGGGNGGGNGNVVLPPNAAAYLQANYPNYPIESVEREDWCNDVLLIEVELEVENGEDIDVYFDLSGNFLFESVDGPFSQVPTAVVNGLAAAYPNYVLEDDDDDDDEVEFLRLADNSLQYLIEIRPTPNSDDDIEVLLDANGNVICVMD